MHSNRRSKVNTNDRNLLGKHLKYCFYLDFKQGNKVIEFDGDYWHKLTNEYDSIRDVILESRGFDILRIKECDYRKDKQQIVKKCVEFLNE